MIKEFEISPPLPSRGSAMALRQQLVDHLMKIKPSVGERFFSDHELARLSRVSRPTVRRAMDDLEREGWIERRPGIGTFIGPRAALTMPHRMDGIPQIKRATRLALLIHMLGDFGHDWYASGVIAGIDQAAEDTGVTLELLGNRDGDVKSISRRLLQSRPDVLAFCAPPLKHTVLISEARRLDIPSIGTGTLLGNIGVPAVCENGEDAARQAVRHLVAKGHRRIGLILGCFAIPWIFQRRQGFIDGLVEAGIEPDECMMLWLNEPDEAGKSEQLRRYLDKWQPTALLFASWVLTPPMAPLVRSGEISIPRDLSVVVFDQQPNVENWVGVSPTTVALPLMEMGKRLARMAHDLANNRAVEPVTTLPCYLIEGESVVDRTS